MKKFIYRGTCKTSVLQVQPLKNACFAARRARNCIASAKLTGFCKRLYILFIFIILISSCQQPPLAEMDRAREAVFRAENDANAVQYAGGTLARAQDALRRMENEADSKRYDAAKTLAAEAIAAAEKAINDGREAAGIAARNDAAAATVTSATPATTTAADTASTAAAAAASEALLAGLRQQIEETTSAVSAARYAQLNLDYDDLEKRIVNAHNTVDRAEADYSAGRYQDASDKAREVRMDLASINQLVANAAPIRKK